MFQEARRRTAATRLFLAVVIAACSVALALETAAAQEDLNSNYRASGDWHFTLTYARTHARSSWDATIKQDKRGNLKGGVEPSQIDCTASLSGKVHLKSVKMNWRVKSPCSNETIALTGRANRHRMTGTFVDSRLGSGGFSAAQDS
jgi:hypothetical protein